MSQKTLARAHGVYGVVPAGASEGGGASRVDHVDPGVVDHVDPGVLVSRGRFADH
jgi:hypothetical protein